MSGSEESSSYRKMASLRLPRVGSPLFTFPLLTTQYTVKCGVGSRHQVMGALFHFQKIRCRWQLLLAMAETDGTTSRLWRRQLPFGSSFHFRWTLGDNLDFSVDTLTEDGQMPTA